jgi:hypothetical protein
MMSWRVPTLFAAGVLAGCMASGPPAPAQAPPPAPAAAGASPSSGSGLLGTPLIIDRTDLRLGTTVQLSHVPNVSELHDLTLVLGLAHIVLTFREWPQDFAALQALNQTPEGVDVIALLPGYPPSEAAADAWNYVNAALRIVIVVPGPPPSRGVISDLNGMRHLERVIAQMNEPARSGFERLQRPLSFRKIVD